MLKRNKTKKKKRLEKRDRCMIGNRKNTERK